MPARVTIQRGKFIGRPIDGKPKDEAELQAVPFIKPRRAGDPTAEGCTGADGNNPE